MEYHDGKVDILDTYIIVLVVSLVPRPSQEDCLLYPVAVPGIAVAAVLGMYVLQGARKKEREREK